MREMTFIDQSVQGQQSEARGNTGFIFTNKTFLSYNLTCHISVESSSHNNHRTGIRNSKYGKTSKKISNENFVLRELNDCKYYKKYKLH
jgi:hypothetical protein